MKLTETACETDPGDQSYISICGSSDPTYEEDPSHTNGNDTNGYDTDHYDTDNDYDGDYYSDDDDNPSEAQVTQKAVVLRKESPSTNGTSPKLEIEPLQNPIASPTPIQTSTPIKAAAGSVEYSEPVQVAPIVSQFGTTPIKLDGSFHEGFPHSTHDDSHYSQEPYIISSNDEYDYELPGYVSLSSGDDSVICLSSDDDDDHESDCDSVISLSSTESDSVIYVGSALKRPAKQEPSERAQRSVKRVKRQGKKDGKKEEIVRVRFDPEKDEGYLTPYLPEKLITSYYAVKRSRHPGIFSNFKVAVNHCRHPGDIHRFSTLEAAAYSMGRNAEYFHSTQRQYHNKAGKKTATAVYSDGSSKKLGNGKQEGGFGVWFGHYHPDNIAGRLTGDLQDPLQAELRGILEAYRVLYNRHDKLNYIVYCDCFSLVKKLNNAGNLPRVYHSTVTSIRTYKELLGPRVKLEHIVGHSGHPGNERADILAKMGRVSRVPSIFCMNAVLEDRYKRTIGADPGYPYYGTQPKNYN